MIKVLWIDDNPTEFSEFLDDAYDVGLDINVCKTVMAGLAELEDRNKIYEAIILDANCKIDDDEREVPQLAALSHAIAGIYARGINLPWFVYTGGAYEGKEALEHIIPQQYRNWDEQQWYNKPDQEGELFDAIKKAVREREITKLKEAHPEAFKICPSQDLVNLLQRINEKEFERDERIPNIIRNIAEKICFFLRDNGIYPEEFKSSNRVKECSIFFTADKNSTYVPIYIQRMFHFLSEYANEGSHPSDPRESSKIREDLSSGKAKYLNRIGVYALLTIFQWCDSFPIGNEEKMKPIHIFFQSLPREEKSSTSHNQYRPFKNKNKV